MRILNDNVLVGNIRSMEGERIGDIFLPETIDGINERPGSNRAAGSRRYDCKVGTVVDFGPDCDSIAEGDDVFLAPMKGVDYKDMRIYKFEELMGKIEK